MLFTLKRTLTQSWNAVGVWDSVAPASSFHLLGWDEAAECFCRLKKIGDGTISALHQSDSSQGRPLFPSRTLVLRGSKICRSVIRPAPGISLCTWQEFWVRASEVRSGSVSCTIPRSANFVWDGFGALRAAADDSAPSQPLIFLGPMRGQCVGVQGTEHLIT